MCGAKIVGERTNMSLLARLAPHLPYVRRYARALTGDQATGDNYVRVALEALAAGERQLPTDMTPRVALYHVFHTIWAATGAQLEDGAAAEGDDAAHRLMRISPRWSSSLNPPWSLSRRGPRPCFSPEGSRGCR